MDCSTPGFPVFHHLLELAQIMSIESVMPFSHLIFRLPLLFLAPIFPSIRVFSNELALAIRWPRYWRFSISPSNEYSRLISFWSPCTPGDSQESSPAPQCKSISSSMLSFLYGSTPTFIHDYWKNHSFDYTDFCQQVMSLLFNTLSRFVTAFLPRSKRLLISWLQSPSAVILETKK